MIKKITAYSFILIANIVLLTHAVFPHHHHKQKVCIEIADCVIKDVAHAHNDSDSNHKPDCHDDLNKCILKQAYVIPSSLNRILDHFEKYSENHYCDFYIHSNIRYFDLQPISEVETYFPKIPSFFISFVTNSVGLRAPPKC